MTEQSIIGGDGHPSNDVEDLVAQMQSLGVQDGRNKHCEGRLKERGISWREFEDASNSTQGVALGRSWAGDRREKRMSEAVVIVQDRSNRDGRIIPVTAFSRRSRVCAVLLCGESVTQQLRNKFAEAGGISRQVVSELPCTLLPLDSLLRHATGESADSFIPEELQLLAANLNGGERCSCGVNPDFEALYLTELRRNATSKGREAYHVLSALNMPSPQWGYPNLDFLGSVAICMGPPNSGGSRTNVAPEELLPYLWNAILDECGALVHGDILLDVEAQRSRVVGDMVAVFNGGPSVVKAGKTSKRAKGDIWVHFLTAVCPEGATVELITIDPALLDALKAECAPKCLFKRSWVGKRIVWIHPGPAGLSPLRFMPSSVAAAARRRTERSGDDRRSAPPPVKDDDRPSGDRHSGGGRSGGKKKPCANFMRTGGCRFGSGCRYSHASGGSGGSGGSSPPLPPGAGQRRSGGWKKKPCDIFMRTGGCRFGSGCRYSHAEDISGSVVASATSGGGHCVPE